VLFAKSNVLRVKLGSKVAGKGKNNEELKASV